MSTYVEGAFRFTSTPNRLGARLHSTRMFLSESRRDSVHVSVTDDVVGHDLLSEMISMAAPERRWNDPAGSCTAWTRWLSRSSSHSSWVTGRARGRTYTPALIAVLFAPVREYLV